MVDQGTLGSLELSDAASWFIVARLLLPSSCQKGGTVWEPGQDILQGSSDLSSRRFSYCMGNERIESGQQ